jgi:hypothetical protein
MIEHIPFVFHFQQQNRVWKKNNHVLGFFFFELFDAVVGVDDLDEVEAETGVEVRLGLDDVWSLAVGALRRKSSVWER